MRRLGVWLRRLPPPGLLAVFYLVFIALGAGLLKLPVSHSGSLTWSDALFTSTSAVTVTGLVVVDTPGAFTLWGQGILMVLMQMGGLGLMTFAALVLVALGIPIGIPQTRILREEMNQTSMVNLTTLAAIILRLALISEAAGTALLAVVFVPDHGWGMGLWHALFHAISAFNNAGFSTFSNSLSDYATTPIVTLTVPALFILSGLGFVVLAELRSKRGWTPLSLHAKLMLAATPALIALSFVAVVALEWTNPGTLGGIESFGGRAQAAFFQAVTPRTAGFNTVDTAEMRDSTALVTMGLMFVGGGSTSTAGGIKLTTIAVLVMATLAFFTRRRQLHAFGRAIGDEEVQKVMALLTVSILSIFVGLLVVVIGSDEDFLVLAFEVVSAFGTVGLSMGATGTLGDGGRAAIMVIMFLGRVGPLVLGFFLATQSRPVVRYPTGRIYLG